jgi:hypothetical protein
VDQLGKGAAIISSKLLRLTRPPGETRQAAPKRIAALTALVLGTALLAASPADASPTGLVVTPTTHDYGEVAIGQSASQTFTITNLRSRKSGNLTDGLTGADPSQFAIVSDTCVGKRLAGGASCSLAVQFGPSVAAVSSASLLVQAKPGGTLTVPLSGTGVTPAHLSITPGSHDYGDVIVGGATAELAYSVTNTGQQTSGALSVSLSGTDGSEFGLDLDDPGSCRNAVLPDGGSCTILVSFQPQSVGDKTVTVEVDATPGGSATSSVSGRGVLGASLSIDPPSWDAGQVVDGSSATRDFTITNVGAVATSSPLTVEGFSPLTGFRIATDGCSGEPLGEGASCRVTASFSPTQGGTVNDTLAVDAEAGVGATASLSATGVGVFVDWDGLFPATPVGSSSTVLVMVYQAGSSITGSLSIVVSGTAFSVPPQAPPPVGCIGASLGPPPLLPACQLAVQFQPSSAGTFTGTLAVSSGGGGTATVQMQGVGV